MAALYPQIKKTGHADVDKILASVHRLIEENSKLQEDIDSAIEYRETLSKEVRRKTKERKPSKR